MDLTIATPRGRGARRTVRWVLVVSQCATAASSDNTAAAGSAPTKIAFRDDALMRLAHALDAILGLAAVVWEGTDDLKVAIRRGTQRAAHETDGLAGAELRTHVHLGFWIGSRLAVQRKSAPVVWGHPSPK